jgi:hypothetical protein
MFPGFKSSLETRLIITREMHFSGRLFSLSVQQTKFQTVRLYLQLVKKVNHLPGFFCFNKQSTLYSGVFRYSLVLILHPQSPAGAAPWLFA